MKNHLPKNDEWEITEEWTRDPLGEFRRFQGPYHLHIRKTVTGMGWRYNIINNSDNQADHHFCSGYSCEAEALFACEKQLEFCFSHHLFLKEKK